MKDYKVNNTKYLHLDNLGDFFAQRFAVFAIRRLISSYLLL